jgi:hypothetical protein
MQLRIINLFLTLTYINLGYKVYCRFVPKIQLIMSATQNDLAVGNGLRKLHSTSYFDLCADYLKHFKIVYLTQCLKLYTEVSQFNWIPYQLCLHVSRETSLQFLL